MHRGLIVNELEWWHETYLPPQGIRGTVIDIGAGCGETANFYLLHGAQRVICIESDPNVLQCLYLNYRRDPRVTIIPAHVEMLKVDIEGAEEGMVVDTHWPHEWKQWKNHGEIQLRRLDTKHK